MKRCWLIYTLALGLIQPVTRGLSSEHYDTRVELLPGVAQAAAWQVREGDQNRLTLSEAPGNVVARFVCTAVTNVEMRLKEPLPVPDWVDGLTFLVACSQVPITMRVDVMVRDANGNEFTFYTQSLPSFKRGYFGPMARRSRQVRFTVPGFEHPRLHPDPTLVPRRPGTTPKKPWTLVGLSLVCEETGKPTAKPAAVTLYIQDLAWTRLVPGSTQLYYQWRNEAGFGELDPAPYLTLGDFWWWPGTYKLTWEIRDRYDALPFMTGGKTFTVAETADRLPLELQLAQRIEFPIREEGTYWVRTRIQRTDERSNYKYYTRVDEDEYRLDVIHGKPSVRRKPLSAEVNTANCPIRIGAGLTSVIFSPQETLKVPIVFDRPADLGTGAVFRISARSFSRNTVLKEEIVQPVWDKEGRCTVMMDLSDLPASAYRIGASIHDGTVLYDKVERVVGKRAPEVKTDTAPIPASVLPASDVLSGKRALFQLADADRFGVGRFPLDEHWEKATKPFLQEAASISRDVEVIVPWPLVEPLPGVFDWSAVDRYLDTAATNGLRVMIWASVRAEDFPEWMPGTCMANEKGDVFSHFAYLFHGMHPNYFHSKDISGPCMTFFEAVAQRYRSHPALDGYYLCMEHPGDAPFRDWYEGYSRESVDDFRQYCRAQWRTIKAANARWGTQFKSWAALTAPDRKTASDRFMLDWLQFKMNGFDTFQKDFVRAVRKHDPVRLAMVYSVGQDNEWYRDQGCMTANGGAHAAIMPSYAEMALRGLPMRTEEITPRFWSATGPYQLDQSLFYVMAGGGVHAHCKAFINTTKRFAECRQPKDSLDRYERFIPIWSELRTTRPVSIETFVFDDRDSTLMNNRSTYSSGGGDYWTTLNLLEAQLPFSNTLPEFAQRGKLLFVTSTSARFMSAAARDQVIRFAERGGTVVLKAFAGSIDPDRPGESWILLRRFGFTPPEATAVPDQYTRCSPVPGAGGVFGETPGDFVLRDLWTVSARAGETTAAVVAGDSNRVAVSWRPFGQGRVAVVWAETVVPPTAGSVKNAARPFFRDFARWAGVPVPAEADSPRLWTHLLKQEDSPVWYGLLHAGLKDGPAVTGRTWWPLLPDGTYEVTELVNNRKLGVIPAEQLRTQGISVTLQPQEVAIYRLKQTSP